LIDGEVDIAVAVEHRDSLAPGDGRVLHAPLYEEPFDAVLPPGHRLADASEVDLAELRDDVWITPWPGNPVHEAVVRACEQARFRPRVECLSDDFSAVCALVSVGAGVALVPRSALHGIRPALTPAVRPLRGPGPTRRVFTAVRRGSEDHPLLRLTLAGLRERAAALSA
ncbi:LysR family transcriptional regulator, partial [Streptomyces sp. SCA3-4]|uniref:LysR substrate-binding domain-containing protein n=1 Tax=Streptomyces sichuanensis TaxID=2871810 RepID=UPI0021F09ED8